MSALHRRAPGRHYRWDRCLNHCQCWLQATKKHLFTSLRLPTNVWREAVLVFSIGCSVCWICSTSLWRLWTRSFCWDFWLPFGYPFRWAESFDRFLCRELVTSLHRLADLLLLFSSNRFSSTSVNYAEECRTFQRFTWHRLLPWSDYQKYYLFYGLFFLGNCVFSIVASMFSNDLWFFGMRRTVAGSGVAVEAEGRTHEILWMFEFVEKGGRFRWGEVGTELLEDSRRL